MKVLLDHNLPIQLKAQLPGHAIFTAREMSWGTLKNGQLIVLAEEAEFAVLVTGDQNLSYQQNHATRTISLVVLTQISRRLLAGNEYSILQAIARAAPGSYEVVAIPGTKRSARPQ